MVYAWVLTWDNPQNPVIVQDLMSFKNNDPLVTVGDTKPRYRRETPDKAKQDPTQQPERKRFLGLF